MKILAPNLYKVTLTNKAMRTSSRNLYMIKSDDRSLMIDTSWKVPECLNDMENALKELSIDYKDLDIFVTHNHADHSGYVSYFTDRGARAFMNPVEITEASDRYHRLYENNTMRRSYTRECGVTKELAPDAWQEINTGADRLAKEISIFLLLLSRRETSSPAETIISRLSLSTVILQDSVASWNGTKSFFSAPIR